MRQFRQFNEAASSGGKRDFKHSERSSSDSPKRRSFSRSESRDSDRPRRPEGRSFERRDSDRPRSRNSGLELHRVVCARCGESCEVPFKPTNSKPVYCRDCFKKNESSDDEKFAPRGKSNDRSGSRAGASSDDIDKINRKLDKIMKALNIE